MRANYFLYEITPICMGGYNENDRIASPELIGWLFGLIGPLRHYFSLYRAVSQREGERKEKKIDERKNVQTTPTRAYWKRSRPLPYSNPNE